MPTTIPQRTHNILECSVLDDLSWHAGDDQTAGVERCNDALEAAQSLHKVQFHLKEQIIIDALEAWVGAQVQLDNNVTGFQPRLLVALSAERDALPVVHPLVHVHLQDLPLLHCLKNRKCSWSAMLMCILIPQRVAMGEKVGCDWELATSANKHLLTMTCECISGIFLVC